MKTLILIFHLLVCIFEIWMLSDFYDAFLGYKNKGKKRNIFIVLCFALIIFAINSFNNTVLNLSVVPFMYFLLAVVGFSGNIYKKIFGTFIGTVVLMGTELIVVGALSVTSQQLIESSMMYEPSAIMLTVIVKIVTLMVFAVIKQFVAKEGTNMDGATIWFLSGTMMRNIRARSLPSICFSRKSDAVGTVPRPCGRSFRK